MGRTVNSPPPPRPGDTVARGGGWHETEQAGRIMGDLCPRHCTLQSDQRGFCFVRQNLGGEVETPRDAMAVLGGSPVAKNKHLRNVGPSLQYKIRDAQGQVR